MSEFPSLPLFTDAFMADTGHLSAQETGAYIMLLMMAWRTRGCRLPDDDAKLAPWARVDPRTWSRIKATVMEFWTLDEEGFWTQGRLSKEREIVSKRAEAARNNGRHGGRPKSLETLEPNNPAGSSWVSQKKAPNPSPNPKILEPSGSNTPPPPSGGLPSAPQTELRSVLDDEHADAVIDHRRKLRRPLSVHAAKLLARKFAECPEPNAAADTMIANGWQGFEPAWLERQQSTGPPSKSRPNAKMQAWDEAISDAKQRESTGETEPRRLAYKRA